jgi:hypothetical protein
MVALRDSGDSGNTAAWAFGRGASTLSSMPSGRLPMRPRAPRPRASSSAGTNSLPLAETCCGRLRSGRRCSPGRHGWTCSALAAAPARPSISAPSIAIRSPRSAPSCSVCGARGARARRRCRSCWACTLCRRGSGSVLKAVTSDDAPPLPAALDRRQMTGAPISSRAALRRG